MFHAGSGNGGKLLAIADAAAIFPPVHFRRIGSQIRASMSNGGDSQKSEHDNDKPKNDGSGSKWFYPSGGPKTYAAAQGYKEIAKQYFKQPLIVCGWVWSFGKWLGRHDGIVTGIATIAIAALTCVLAIYASHQEAILNRQTGDDEITNRAFVFVDGLLPLSRMQDPEGLKYLVSIKFTNSGNTPTRHLTLQANCVPEGPDSSNPFGVLAAHPMERVPTLIGPHATVQAGCTFAIPVIDAMKTSQRKSYIVGRIDYQDAFDANYWHKTEFKLQIMALATDPKGNVTGLSINSVGKHNCADEECPPD